MSTNSVKVKLKQAPTYCAPIKHYELQNVETGEVYHSISTTSAKLAGVLFKNEIQFNPAFANFVPEGF